MYLKVIQPGATATPVFLATHEDVSFGAGFHDAEWEDGRPFRWMSRQGRLDFTESESERFLELWILSEFHDCLQQLTIEGTGSAEPYPLVHGWQPLSVVVPAHAAGLDLRASPEFPSALHAGDRRSLTIRLRDLRLHRDPARHRAVRRQYDNAVLNLREVHERRTTLASTPPSLGIDLHGACNVKPPCVYCEWDYSKDLEGDAAAVPFTREMLEEWGEFFDQSVHLVNCSIGEPFMMKNLDQLLDIFGNEGKVLEMTTNGQILTDSNIRKLLGRPIDLYISLDAATPSTYSRLRNNTFEKILANLGRLIAAKGGRGHFPHVYLVFMPMRCNAHELEAFLELAAGLGVDRAVLRPLNYSPSSSLSADRGGYRFEYQDELLPFKELIRLSALAARTARTLELPLSDQMDFGGSMREMFGESYESEESTSTDPEPVAARDLSDRSDRCDPIDLLDHSDPIDPSDHSDPVDPSDRTDPSAPTSLGGAAQPACLEPWKSLYILRRGVMPCCYGGAPIAPMEEYRQAWNSPLMQGIRQELLDGRFHDYCLRSSACPIVRKAQHARALPLRQRALMAARDLLSRADRRSGGRLIPAVLATRRRAGAVYKRFRRSSDPR
jgi:MoaA/NifB/PqqE/SkfB family radical SAM enzyme